MPDITSYSFGRITVDGLTYTNDIIILGGKVIPEWWRRQGHLLTPPDLDRVVAAAPAVFVVGTGSSGMLRVSPEAEALLSSHGIEMEALPTARAVQRFAALAGTGTDVGAGLHLTC